MKTNLILRLIAMLFVSVTAVLLILTIANVIDSSETRDGIMKLAAISGILAAASMALSFLGSDRS